MFFRNIFGISAALAMTASALPVAPRDLSGSVQIVNNMGQDIYLWSVSDYSSEMQTLSANGGTYSETWQTNPNGGGISIKMGADTTGASVLQFEYTEVEDLLYWDMSSINLAKDSPIVSAGFAVTISDASCSTVTCAAGDANCSESYQQPDDVNTRACGTGAAYTLTLG
ncbi:hypothetical protein P175DRAFT_0531088 [Aspergillus ochraceoroseus IBT 24754]|uniref:Antigenic thaumatin domain protein n=3 Tax=Aspergillus subgen. Nidulantes TaxID=2720870 RepID=A0A0F8UUA6_9EURO|nr:uncharacterized protein P175DRAFT_0531088 [Aspergillus ochraceoroseus IBT 24754]KKK14376.1 hypothetical protein ARAM_000092 [Aspergillus rambellii]KKK25571.1 hypothetical protein AOCH_000095 [Aspergillus ochraceoroseus]PTU21570.1 hypothetical protein P175DRAFT_0531088 [Aspergillus ochraceoroseus IBT 24754]